MSRALEPFRDQIAAAFERYRVKRAEVFGSAAVADDLASCGDVDLLVEFDSSDDLDLFSTYFPLRDELADILGKPIDLIESRAITSDTFRRVIDQTREVLYAA